jgi:hypothetical protein
MVIQVVQVAVAQAMVLALEEQELQDKEMMVLLVKMGMAAAEVVLVKQVEALRKKVVMD